MVAGAFPLFKLMSLAAKQLSKPIANAIKSGAKQSPVFRTYVCVIPGQGFHWLETTVKMRLMGHIGPSKIKPLNEEVAVNLAAELLGEGFLFAVGVGTLLFEYRRGIKKDERKEDEQNRHLAELEDKMSEIGLLIETQAAEIRELNRMVQGLRGSSDKPGKSEDTKALKT
ncbi:optic atrophy 3 protein homolog [Actinia tenebrosa]|uniref:Optic atrophy 3 protein homolog n=1 Tax=Actinia tenebrosa TaxID=6105 RepID=A0A6P8HXA6_ACTTE|nr:optic atrophy 3 protein homolog [Actinia tenebrosa]